MRWLFCRMMLFMGPEVEVEWEDLADWYVGSDDVMTCGLEDPEVCESCQ